MTRGIIYAGSMVLTVIAAFFAFIFVILYWFGPNEWAVNIARYHIWSISAFIVTGFIFCILSAIDEHQRYQEYLTHSKERWG